MLSSLVLRFGLAVAYVQAFQPPHARSTQLTQLYGFDPNSRSSRASSV